jgi:cellulose synthase/poly-beta-1,6-N-acetylglucosamine synthase-like glycosyltransferase
MSIHSIAVLAAQGPLGEYWSKFTDANRNPFRGLYHFNAFDLAVVIPYFLVLAILAGYGLHRYWLVYLYTKFRRNVPGPPPEMEAWPKVTVQLPVYNERYVIERLEESVVRFDYPRNPGA